MLSKNVYKKICLQNHLPKLTSQKIKELRKNKRLTEIINSMKFIKTFGFPYYKKLSLKIKSKTKKSKFIEKKITPGAARGCLAFYLWMLYYFYRSTQDAKTCVINEVNNGNYSLLSIWENCRVDYIKYLIGYSITLTIFCL